MYVMQRCVVFVCMEFVAIFGFLSVCIHRHSMCTIDEMMLLRNIMNGHHITLHTQDDRLLVSFCKHTEHAAKCALKVIPHTYTIKSIVQKEFYAGNLFLLCEYHIGQRMRVHCAYPPSGLRCNWPGWCVRLWWRNKATAWHHKSTLSTALMNLCYSRKKKKIYI